MSSDPLDNDVGLKGRRRGQDARSGLLPIGDRSTEIRAPNRERAIAWALAAGRAGGAVSADTMAAVIEEEGSGAAAAGARASGSTAGSPASDSMAARRPPKLSGRAPRSSPTTSRSRASPRTTRTRRGTVRPSRAAKRPSPGRKRNIARLERAEEARDEAKDGMTRDPLSSPDRQGLRRSRAFGLPQEPVDLGSWRV